MLVWRAHPVGHVVWLWCQGKEDWWRESLMKVRACHLCSSRNFSPHWCTTHLHNSFSLLLPIFSRSSLELATTTTTTHLQPHQSAFTLSFAAISLHTYSTCIPTRSIPGKTPGRTTAIVRLANWLEGHWNQTAVHYNDRAAEMSFQFTVDGEEMDTRRWWEESDLGVESVPRNHR